MSVNLMRLHRQVSEIQGTHRIQDPVSPATPPLSRDAFSSLVRGVQADLGVTDG